MTKENKMEEIANKLRVYVLDQLADYKMARQMFEEYAHHNPIQLVNPEYQYVLSNMAGREMVKPYIDALVGAEDKVATAQNQLNEITSRLVRYVLYGAAYIIGVGWAVETEQMRALAGYAAALNRIFDGGEG